VLFCGGGLAWVTPAAPASVVTLASTWLLVGVQDAAHTLAPRRGAAVLLLLLPQDVLVKELPMEYNKQDLLNTAFVVFGKRRN
jgi:hypothetical protein